MVRRASPSLAVLLVLLVGACGPAPTDDKLPGAVSAENHPFFPIGSGAMHELGLQRLVSDGPFMCESCHPADAPSFSDFVCTGCHGHTPQIAGRVHAQTPNFVFEAPACLGCHPKSDHMPFRHAGVTDECAVCHREGAGFPALPVAGFTHPPMNGNDCSSCHVVTTWKNATGSTASSAAHP